MGKEERMKEKMKKRRSVYTFQINCNPNIIDDLIQAFIQGNDYVLKIENGEKFYTPRNGVTRYLSYNINEQTLMVAAWIKDAFGFEVDLENTDYEIATIDYRENLGKLFQEIERINNENRNMNNNVMKFDPYTGQPINKNVNTTGMNFDPYTGRPIQQNNMNQFAQSFLNETRRKQENMCEWAFWVSLFGLIASFFGMVWGVIIYFFIYYYAIQGLKTRKRGKAIVTIIISTLSILITIVIVILTANI